jgi:YidC/Oxa1 family membrane protein insertase
MAKIELSSEMRILLAFALSFGILLLSRPLLVREPAPAESPAPKTTETAPPPASESSVPSESSTPPVPAEPTQGAAEEEIVIEGDLYRVVFSTRGAVVKSWTIERYQDEQGNALELVNPEAAARYGNPLSFWMAEEAPRQEVNRALFVPSATGTLKAPVTLQFEYSSGRMAARKQFTFSPDSYVVEVATDVTRDGEPVAHQLAWRGGFGDIHDAGSRGPQWDVFHRGPQDMVRVRPQDVEGESSTASGPFAFAGIEDHFFAAAFLPPQAEPSAASFGEIPLRVIAFREEIAHPSRPETKMPTVGVAVGSGDSARNRLRLYVGPKQSDILAAVEPRLAELVNYGWFSFIAKPLFVALRWTHDNVVGNYGWAIMVLTIAINMALFPLKLSSLRSAMKMQQLAPQLRAIQDKYKQFKLKDPRRNQMSQETMELYKKHGVNPIGGCLPMLLQIPFFVGFYNVLLSSIEMRHAVWIGWWVRDLSAPESFYIKALPLLMCGTQFVLQKMSPTPSPDPTQQKIMLFMPVMFLVFFWSMSSGLVLYWLTSNVIGIAQQWYINRTEMRHLVEEKRAAAAAKKKRALGKK